MKKILFLFFVLILSSCNKKNQQANNNPVPSVPVYLNIYPNDPLYFKLQAIGGWQYIDGGINGIILYRKSEQEFVAVERTSSYYPNDPSAKVYVMNDNFTLRDTVSNSRWRIFDGTVTQPPATWPLRLYGTSYDGNLLRIMN